MGATGPRRFLSHHHQKLQRKKAWDDYPPPVRDQMTGCLRWQGTHHSAGYGLIGKAYAHRVAFECVYGPIPDGLEIDHVATRGCRYRDCVEPTHLEAVTHPENVRRSARVQAQIARTHCPRNHEYAGHNLIVRRGKRECRTCTYERNAAARKARRERQKA